MRNTIVVAAAAAALSTFASFGLSRAAPKPIRRGDLDLSSPYIPPAAPKLTAEQNRQRNAHIARAAEKRARKAERLKGLVAKGAMVGA